MQYITYRYLVVTALHRPDLLIHECDNALHDGIEDPSHILTVDR